MAHFSRADNTNMRPDLHLEAYMTEPLTVRYPKAHEQLVNNSDVPCSSRIRSDPRSLMLGGGHISNR